MVVACKVFVVCLSMNGGVGGSSEQKTFDSSKKKFRAGFTAYSARQQCTFVNYFQKKRTK